MKNILFVYLFLIISLSYAQEKPVRMGIAGMTHDHVRQILNNPNRAGVEIIGFAEPNKELAFRLLKQYKLPESLWYANALYPWTIYNILI